MLYGCPPERRKAVIELVKIGPQDAKELYQMRIQAFQPLLDQYQDFDTNPAAESFERFQRYFRENSDCYFIEAAGKRVGALRVVRLSEKECRLSPIFILPEYQGRGYAQQALAAVEELYPQARRWTLDTIKQEPKLLHLYEKAGYRQNSETKPLKEGMDLVFLRKLFD